MLRFWATRSGSTWFTLHKRLAGANNINHMNRIFHFHHDYLWSPVRRRRLIWEGLSPDTPDRAQATLGWVWGRPRSRTWCLREAWSSPPNSKIPWAGTDTYKVKASTKITWDLSRISGERDSQATDTIEFGNHPNQMGRADRWRSWVSTPKRYRALQPQCKHYPHHRFLRCRALRLRWLIDRWREGKWRFVRTEILASIRLYKRLQSSRLSIHFWYRTLRVVCPQAPIQRQHGWRSTTALQGERISGCV